MLFLNGITAMGQNITETYKFKEDIYKQIEQDTADWRYQTGAAELAFSSLYLDVLHVWDKDGFKVPTITKEDTLYFIKSKKVDAKEYIIEQSKEAQIVVINEAHHIASHRTFTKSLLQGLYENGYRYLGLEALFDTLINERKYPILSSGFYTKEPEFGNLISEALNIGFTLFGYEASRGKNGEEREIEQAENIQRFLEDNPDGKVLIHCGYAHAYENEYPAWGKAMAGRLRDNMKLDPLTIEQTMFLEKSDKESNHPFIGLVGKMPSILIDENGEVFNGLSDKKQTDIVVIHPKTQYVNGRPSWLKNGKQTYTIPASKTDQYGSVLILAYRNGEFDNNGIPADILEISSKKSSRDLFLNEGKYEIVIKDREYNIVDRYTILL